MAASSNAPCGPPSIQIADERAQQKKSCPNRCQWGGEPKSFVHEPAQSRHADTAPPSSDVRWDKMNFCWHSSRAYESRALQCHTMTKNAAVIDHAIVLDKEDDAATLLQ